MCKIFENHRPRFIHIYPHILSHYECAFPHQLSTAMKMRTNTVYLLSCLTKMSCSNKPGLDLCYNLEAMFPLTPGSSSEIQGGIVTGTLIRFL